MSKIILFSSPSESAMQIVKQHIFNPDLKDKRIAFVPSEGMTSYKEEYKLVWDEWAKEHGFELVYVDLAAEDFEKERNKITGIKNVFITGGNTFTLMHLLRKTGFDNYIKNLETEEDTIITGFSAGAMILTPTIEAAGFDWEIGHDDNDVKLEDFSGLNLVDFELVPHYDATIDSTNLEKYRKNSKYEVKALTDEEVLVI
jgi:dipeptidase E